jgi:hypothetical protein
MIDPTGFHYAPKPITLRRARLHLKLGIPLEDEKVAVDPHGRCSSAVQVTDVGLRRRGAEFRATKDIAIEDDLIEEVGRMFRYDNIPERPLHGTVEPPVRNEELFLVRRLLEVACTTSRSARPTTTASCPTRCWRPAMRWGTPTCRCQSRWHPRSRASVATCCRACSRACSRTCATRRSAPLRARQGLPRRDGG